MLRTSPARLKLLFGVFLTSSLVVLLLVSYVERESPHFYCYQRETYEAAAQLSAANLEEVLDAEVQPDPGRSIFFHETSCRHPAVEVMQLLELNARQACAIESAALHNNNTKVFVLFAMTTYRNRELANPLVEALESYGNVYLRNLNIWKYAAGTPIESWLQSGQLFESRYLLSHVSDVLRYLTLWRWGGTYLDLDVVMQRSMEQVPPNYTGAESDENLAAGVMNFGHDGFGHQIADACLRDLRLNFDGDDWGTNGPGVITRVMREVCGTNNIRTMLEPHRCKGFKVFGREAFYAIPWREWQHFFAPQHLNATMQRTADSYVVHVWNKFSLKGSVKVGAQAAYGKIASKHCPKVYAAAGEYF